MNKKSEFPEQFTDFSEGGEFSYIKVKYESNKDAVGYNLDELIAGRQAVAINNEAGNAEGFEKDLTGFWHGDAYKVTDAEGKIHYHLRSKMCDNPNMNIDVVLEYDEAKTIEKKARDQKSPFYKGHRSTVYYVKKIVLSGNKEPTAFCINEFVPGSIRLN